MTKQQLVNALKESGLVNTKKNAAAVLDLIFGEISYTVSKNGSFRYPNFGTFTVKHRSARTIKHVQTQEYVHVPSRNALTFKPAKAMKGIIQSFNVLK
eukprot:TRINITY_DN1759_c0_g2_i1.p2 TRINITY_DN1759_c0_g2~~TRINITY_DN1759_c0_g2_i1.p2  ORF type:complete len:112 (+),score=29.89 TRINITY_DN1759_c0_g2_i1:45-338(+)